MFDQAHGQSRNKKRTLNHSLYFPEQESVEQIRDGIGLHSQSRAQFGSQHHPGRREPKKANRRQASQGRRIHFIFRRDIQILI